MTIATEIQRIKDNIANTYTALGEKGATIPEVQNSANLADTVATVTTGGGGSYTYHDDYNQKDWESVKAIVDTIDVFDSTLVYTQCENLGWYRGTASLTGPSSATIWGIVLNNSLSKIYVSKNYMFYVKFPNSATIETYNNDNYVINFNGDERWLVGCSNSYNINGYTCYAVSNLSYGGIPYNYDNVKGLYLKTKNTDTSIKYYWDGANAYMRFDAFSERLRRYKIQVGSTTTNGRVLLDTSINNVTPSFLSFIFSLDNPEETLECIQGYNNGELTINSCDLLNPSSSYGKTQYSIFYRDVPKKTPLIFDFTNETANPCYPFIATTYGDDDNTKSMPSKSWQCPKIILPPITTYLYTKEGGNKVSVVWDRESLQFLADNAPTVSNLNLYMGSRGYQQLLYGFPEIGSLLKSKGWIVNEY